MALRSLLWFATPPGPLGLQLTTAQLQGSIFADTYGYTMLFSRDPAVQGTYLDFFTPATPTCIADESMYDVSACLSHSSNCQRTHGNVDYDVNVANHDADRMLYQRFGIFGVNTWYTRNTSFADIEIASLPHLDSSRPLPAENTLPPAMYDQFDLLESAMHKHFRFNAIMEAKMSAARHEIGKLAAADSPVIGCVRYLHL